MRMLKKCPFCGGDAYLERSARAYRNSNTERAVFVHCTVCNARSGRVFMSDYGKSSHSKDAEDKAVEMWNKRV